MYSIDLSETIISFSLLQIINRLKRMKTGETMEILGIEQDFIPHLTRVLPAGTFEMAGIEAMSAGSPYFRLRLKKTDTSGIGEFFFQSED